MAEAPQDTVRLFSGLLAHMRQIVGEGACYTMLHYGATEEGKRLGSGSGPDDLPEVLGRLDALLHQRSEIVRDDGANVTVRVHGWAFGDGEAPALERILLGLVEGALTASRAGRYTGSSSARDGGLVLELRRDP